MGRGADRRQHAHAWRTEPLERRAGSVVGGVTRGAGLRSQIRPSARRSLPPRVHVSPMATGQAARGLPLRPARSHTPVRVGEGFRRRTNMNTRPLVAIVLIGLSAVSPAAQAPVTRGRFEAITSLAEAKMREYGVPGVAIGIIENGVVTTKGLGVTNLEDPLPITEHTVFPIASISKTFAATAMMRLFEQGKVDLKAPVRTYLPDFRVRDDAVSRHVTVWNLLTHSSGWEGQVSGPERGEDTLRNFVATVMPDLMQVAPSGAAWSYNNAGFSVAGRVIEAVTGTSINHAIRDLVFTPVGLEHAGTTAGDFIV